MQTADTRRAARSAKLTAQHIGDPYQHRASLLDTWPHTGVARSPSKSHTEHTQTSGGGLDSGVVGPPPPWLCSAAASYPGTLLSSFMGVAKTQPKRKAGLLRHQVRFQTQGTPLPPKEGSGRGEVSGVWKSDL